MITPTQNTKALQLVGGYLLFLYVTVSSTCEIISTPGTIIQFQSLGWKGIVCADITTHIVPGDSLTDLINQLNNQ